MTEEQLSFKEEKIIEILNEIHVNFRNGEFAKVKSLLEDAFKIDSGYPGIVSALKCTEYWIKLLKDYNAIEGGFQRGEYLMSQWNAFQDFLYHINAVPDLIIYSIKQFIFNCALIDYTSILDAANRYDPTLLLQIGRSHKAIGNYEDAVQLLENANQIDFRNAAILAELADCYSLIDELKASKLFFREAFFINPHKINLYTLESPIIVKLVERLIKKGYNKHVLAEWIPVYGNVWNVFNVKRELKPLEIGKLKQNIFALEREVKGNNSNRDIILPKLLNHYFWLIDHYISAHEEQSRIEEILEKIKNIDESIYIEYTK
ncbi:MAG: tetratricopeptide repeat protein [Spirochaetes bacterium]|nr:tetratricopeptide repeat protein [Spirochaetota bacterium]